MFVNPKKLHTKALTMKKEKVYHHPYLLHGMFYNINIHFTELTVLLFVQKRKMHQHFDNSVEQRS